MWQLDRRGYALYPNTTGYHNTACGYNALYRNTEGFNNTANGIAALSYNTTGKNNTALGSFSGPMSNSLSNTTALGYLAKPTANNTVVIGNSLITSISGQVAWSWPSDGRFKQNIQEDVLGIDFIMGLRPITYNIDIIGIDNHRIGFYQFG